MVQPAILNSRRDQYQTRAETSTKVEPVGTKLVRGTRSVLTRSTRSSGALPQGQTGAQGRRRHRRGGTGRERTDRPASRSSSGHKWCPAGDPVRSWKPCRHGRVAGRTAGAGDPHRAPAGAVEGPLPVETGSGLPWSWTVRRLAAGHGAVHDPITGDGCFEDGHRGGSERVVLHDAAGLCGDGLDGVGLGQCQGGVLPPRNSKVAVKKVKSVAAPGVL